MISLLRMQRGHLSGVDLLRLAIRGAPLQGVEMQDTTLAGVTFQDSVFTVAFDAIAAVAISPNGQYWAAGSRRGEVLVWEAEGQTLHRVWQAHSDYIHGLAFSPEGEAAENSSSGRCKVWSACTP